MKTTNIRELKHDTAAVLQWVQQGHEVEITRHQKVVAVLRPPSTPKGEEIERPDFAARMEEIWGNKKPVTSTWTELINEARGER
jgi:antitoxin (DNA-binding transcriptional repressor) of toxin-antitoxin stability system